jgi:hypothetical protein
MLKYSAAVFLSLTLSSIPASAQSKAVAMNVAEVQKLAAQREAANSATPSDMQERLEREQIASLMTQRHTQLRIDTEKLVALASELKLHVDKSGVNVLSMDVIKKAQEIQKLAKSVQDKMRNAY